MVDRGRIHSVETFGTVDGPGIRFVVFMQGCPLRCKYCHNRDTWDACGGKEITIDQLMSEIRSYKEFYITSNGGVTASGGEPTLQADFVKELFKCCKDEGLSTALDTSGFVDIEKVESLLDVTDLVLLDIKQIESEKHLNLTGVSNEKTLKLLQYLYEQNKPVWIRYVLVKGITDAVEDVEKLGQILQGKTNIQKVEILPYHKMGMYKWEELGEKYELKDIEPPEKEDVEKIKQILRGFNLPVY